MKLFLSNILGRTKNIINTFSFSEKIIFYFFLSLAIITGITSLYLINNKFLIERPAQGGSLSEGVVGTPRFINPLLAQSDTDRDFVSLIYSGLTRTLPTGEIIDDLAEKHEISEDGTEYTFKIRKNAIFQDGTKVTADDVVFTIEKIKDPVIKSPKRPNWEGVEVVKIDDYTVKFVLKEPYAPFLQNTSIGILPLHVWSTEEDILFSNHNINPIGSGPYQIKTITRDSKDIPVKYTLVPNKNFALGKPYIKNIYISIYSNQEELLRAFNKGDIDSIHGISPKQVSELKTNSKNILQYPLPRIFGIFLNPAKNSILSNLAVRQALDTAIPKDSLINDVLLGYGKVAKGPVPNEILKIENNDSTKNTSPKDAALEILSKDGWKVGEDGILFKKTTKTNDRLVLSISTANIPELQEVANKITESWKQIGVDVNIKAYDQGDLNQSIIRPREFDTLLFGVVIKNVYDLYAFWHSSQRNDPGLNIAGYTNSNVDSYLEKLRENLNDSDKQKNLLNFSNTINKELPGIFLYSPNFIYIVPQNLSGPSPFSIGTPSERFSDIYKWYTEKEKVWKIFIK